MRTQVHLLAATLIAVVSSAAVAGTIVVPNDQATIQDAIDAAADGDLIVVKKGTYPENVVVDGGAGKNNLTIKGIGKPVIDGGNTTNCLTIMDATGITVTGMHFTKARVNGVLVQGSSDVTISKCSAFENSCEDNVLGSGMHIETSSNVTIEKSQFSDNCVYAIFLSDPTGVALTSCTIEKNRITDGEQGLSLQGTNHTVTKNKFVDTDGIAIFIDDESADLTLEKNSVKFSLDEALLAGGGSGHEFLRNKYVKTKSVGVYLAGDDLTMEGDKVIKSSSTGVDMPATNSTLRKLKVIASGDHGIDVRGTGNTIDACKVLLTKEDAFKARVGGNTFTNNKAKRTRARDLDDDAGEGANTYSGNRFDPDKISPECLVF